MGKGNRGHMGFQARQKWTTGEEKKECKNCDYLKDDKGFAIKIHPDTFSAIFFLCEKIETEWQMLLKGVENNGEVIVSGYYIPVQEVTSSTVKNLDAIDEEFIRDNEIVATIHSHANMNVFFSGTDDEFTNMSHIKHHIVINNEHKMVAKSRYDLPCGMAKFADSKVMTLIPAVQSVEGMENITKKIYQGFHSGNNHNSNNQTPNNNRNGRFISKIYPKVKDAEEDEFVRNKWGAWVLKKNLSTDDLLELIELEEMEAEQVVPKDSQIEYLPHNID